MNKKKKIQRNKILVSLLTLSLLAACEKNDKKEGPPVVNLEEKAREENGETLKKYKPSYLTNSKEKS